MLRRAPPDSRAGNRGRSARPPSSASCPSLRRLASTKHPPAEKRKRCEAKLTLARSSLSTHSVAGLARRFVVYDIVGLQPAGRSYLELCLRAAGKVPRRLDVAVDQRPVGARKVGVLGPALSRIGGGKLAIAERGERLRLQSGLEVGDRIVQQAVLAGRKFGAAQHDADQP